MMEQWTPTQWAALHQHVVQPADADIVQAVIEGAGLIEPSDWHEASSQIAPWVHITSMFTNVVGYGSKDVGIFLREMRRYVPQDDMVRLTVATLVQTLSQSFEPQGQSVQHWNALLRTLGAAPGVAQEPDLVGQWSL